MSEFDHKAKQAEHMAHRYSQHKSLRKTAEEFGTSKSSVHRTVKKYKDDDDAE